MVNNLSDKEIHRKYNRPFPNDLTGQDAEDYEVFLDTKRKELKKEANEKPIILAGISPDIRFIDEFSDHD